MPRLIETEALMKRISCYPQIKETVANVLRYVPTVDAVEVVQCKECESWGLNAIKKDEKGEAVYGDCLHFCVSTPKGFYCAWGERREDE